MRLKYFLVLMTIVAVISDSMLHPFYPQYFSQVFAVSDAQHVGFYIAACSLTVMLSFPIWAHWAKTVDVLCLLIGTQIATGLLSLLCYYLTDLSWFWFVSLLSMVFKASYLLIYPYVMSLEEKGEHINTIGLLAFTVYFGNILAATLSGLIFELLEPRYLFAFMAVGDLIQTLICVLLLKKGEIMQEAPEKEEVGELPSLPRAFVPKLGFIMLLFYFSAYLTEPFFSLFWEKEAMWDNKIVAGLIFSIPGFAALCGLFYNARNPDAESSSFSGVVPAVLLGIAGLLLQVSGFTALLILGRFFYGWALFQCMVRLDALLFKMSNRESYAMDFSKINMFQALGIQAASFAAGSLVFQSGLKIPFFMAALGFGLGTLVYRSVFREQLRSETLSVRASL